ncbi:AAA family ATPase [Methylophaga sp. UBA5088]|uniref:AAA family ATPase n=1 Tax=Methylophaga sp. UBA5088 TaxID=1946898 RepID=UPI00259CBFDD|nr:AAA family ATPase [Methylophaga sp. UBA5088]
MSKFTWIPAFSALSEWLETQQDHQSNLIDTLESVGVKNGLIDRDNSEQESRLSEMDPFTFFAMLMKQGEEKRLIIFQSLIKELNLDAVAPEDFDGVPSAQALRAWLFPYKRTRTPDMVETLWKVFFKAKTRDIGADRFDQALTVPNTGFAKLTQCLFYAYPETYLPIDSQTRPWLEKNSIPEPNQSWGSYIECLDKVRDRFPDKSFPEISREAWLENRNNPFNAASAISHLIDRYPDSPKPTQHIFAVQLENGKELALDPKTSRSAKIFFSQMPSKSIFDGELKHYMPEKSRNHHLKQRAPSLSIGNDAYLLTVTSLEQLEQLCDWYEEKITKETTMEASTKENLPAELNQILYGPPGTGKTYATTELAVQLAEPDWYEQLMHHGMVKGPAPRDEIKEKYDELVLQGRIAFTTFHQSFSYEDFIEGIRAKTDEESSNISYEIENGVFKRIAEKASKATDSGRQLGISATPKIWKISIGKKDEHAIRTACLNSGEARIGWNDTGDLSLETEQRSSEQIDYWEKLSEQNKNTIRNFSEDIEVGDILLCLRDKSTIQAVGVVTGDYFFDEDAESNPGETQFAHCRPVNWLLKDIELDIKELNQGSRLVQKTVYALDRMNWDGVLNAIHEQGYQIAVERHDSKKPNYVLIIDEINRGNISRIFGELITLIEADKRMDGEDVRSSLLPYSKERFSVPSNLYLLGTMNTADKSLAHIDLALRRRFSFVELMPAPELLDEVEVYGFKVGDLLRTINNRIDVLLDRDHLIGHSYFWPLRESDGSSKEEKLAYIFEKKIIPLLQEYFFADWERISWVLNDIDKNEDERFIILQNGDSDLGKLFSDKVLDTLQDRRYLINKSAFSNPRSYLGIFK